MAQPKVVRSLGSFEQYSASRCSLGLYRCITNTCRYTAPPAQDGSPEVSLQADIERALAQVVLKLSALRVGIVGEDEKTNKPCFVQVPSVDLRNHIDWRPIPEPDGRSTAEYDADLLRAIERQHDEPWPDMSRQPPWRLAIFANAAGGWADVIFAVHHSLGDGKSAMLFHPHFLDALNFPSSPSSSPSLEALFHDHVLTLSDVPVKLVPPQEELVKFKTSVSYLLGQVWQEFGYPGLFGGSEATAAPWVGGPVQFEPINMHLRLVTVPDAVLQDLLATCRNERTTLTPMIHALVACLLARRLPADAAPTFACVTPVSLRRFAELPPGFEGVDIDTSMTNLVTTHHYVFEPEVIADMREQMAAAAAAADPGLRVDHEGSMAIRGAELLPRFLAQELTLQLKQRLASLPRDDIMGLLGWVTDWHGWWRKHLGQPREASWRVSNVGSIPGESKGENKGEDKDGGGGRGWRIRRSIYAQSALVTGPAFSVNVSGVRGEGLCITLSWQEGVVDTTLMEGLAADLQASLAEFDRTGQFDVAGRLRDVADPSTIPRFGFKTTAAQAEQARLMNLNATPPPWMKK